MSKNTIREMAFIPGKIFADTIFIDSKNQYCSTTKEQYLKDGYVILPEDEAIKQIDEAIENKYFNDIQIIDEDRYYDMLEVLPPLKHFKDGFTMLEKQINDVTNAFIKIDNFYFELFVRTSWDFKKIKDTALTLLLRKYKNVCDSHDWDYELHYIDDVKNNDNSLSHLVNVITKG